MKSASLALVALVLGASVASAEPRNAATDPVSPAAQAPVSIVEGRQAAPIAAVSLDAASACVIDHNASSN